MKHRLFVSISLPEAIKNVLIEYQQKWSRQSRGSSIEETSGPDLPVKWTKSDNLHITLVFIGEVEHEDVPAVGMAIKEAVLKQKLFNLKIEKIAYSPYKVGREVPKMIWASGELPNEFLTLKKDIEKRLKTKINFVPEKRESQLHITLARVKDLEWRRIEPDEQPEINEFLELEFQVDSIELIESVLKREGPDYSIINFYEFGK